MKLIFFGATGMVGAGTLREALADPEVTEVLSVSRRTCKVQDSKLQQLILADLFDLAGAEGHLDGWDACIWAVGVSSNGLDEPAYAKVTEELTLLWAKTLLDHNPGMSFCYCSAAGANWPLMWARVRRRVEAAIQSMPFRYSGCVRPAFIRPGPGIHSTVKLYEFFLNNFNSLWPLIMKALPWCATTSERLGRAMLNVVKGRADKFILEPVDINRLGSVSLPN